MKTGILQTGRSPEKIRDVHGGYDDLSKGLLGGRGFEFEAYAVLDSKFPTSARDANGWLITGSRVGTIGSPSPAGAKDSSADT